MRATVELIDDFEDRLLQLLWRGLRCEQHPYSEMGFGAQFLRDQGVGGFLDTVVDETCRNLPNERSALLAPLPKAGHASPPPKSW